MPSIPIQQICLSAPNQGGIEAGKLQVQGGEVIRKVRGDGDERGGGNTRGSSWSAGLYSSKPLEGLCLPSGSFSFPLCQCERLHGRPEGPRVAEHSHSKVRLSIFIWALQEITPFCSRINWGK